MNGKNRKLHGTLTLLLCGLSLLVVTGCAGPKYRVLRPVGGPAPGDPTVSPDGRYVAFSETPGQRPILFVTAADGTALRFTGYTDWWGDRSDIVLIGADGTERRNLTERAAGGFRPRWSADGRYLFFTTGRRPLHQLFKIRLEDSVLLDVSHSKDDDCRVNVSPDGQSIVFDRDKTPVQGGPAVVIASADGSNQRTLLTSASWPTWSPDGRWIAETHWSPSGERTYHRWVVHPDGSEGHDVYIDGVVAGWTPDSKALVYYTTTSWIHENVLFARIDGSRPKLVLSNVVHAAFDVAAHDPRCPWNSAGTQLVLAVNSVPGSGAAAFRLGGREAIPTTTSHNLNGLVILSAGGDVIRDLRVQDAKHMYWGACWAPNGKDIWFRKEPLAGEPTGGIYVVHEDGSDERQVVADQVTWQESFMTLDDVMESL